MQWKTVVLACRFLKSPFLLCHSLYSSVVAAPQCEASHLDPPGCGDTSDRTQTTVIGTVALVEGVFRSFI